MAPLTGRNGNRRQHKFSIHQASAEYRPNEDASADNDTARRNPLSGKG